MREIEFSGRVISIERGNRQVECSSRPSGRKRLIVSILQTSDYATYLYVRLANWREKATMRAGLRKRMSLNTESGPERQRYEGNSEGVQCQA